MHRPGSASSATDPGACIAHRCHAWPTATFPPRRPDPIPLLDLCHKVTSLWRRAWTFNAAACNNLTAVHFSWPCIYKAHVDSLDNLFVPPFSRFPTVHIYPS